MFDNQHYQPFPTERESAEDRARLARPFLVVLIPAIAASVHHRVARPDWFVAMLATIGLSVLFVLVAIVPRQRLGFMRLWVLASLLVSILMVAFGN